MEVAKNWIQENEFEANERHRFNGVPSNLKILAGVLYNPASFINIYPGGVAQTTM